MRCPLSRIGPLHSKARAADKANKETWEARWAQKYLNLPRNTGLWARAVCRTVHFLNIQPYIFKVAVLLIPLAHIGVL